MKINTLCLAALLTVLPGLAAMAANTFVIGSQAVSNPPAGTFVNVWPTSGGESPGNAIDGVLTNKYLNFAKLNTGYIYTSTTAGAVVTGINFVSGNDAPLRDPASYTLFGSNSAVSSNIAGTVYDVDAAFTQISTGLITLPDAPRNQPFNTTFTNSAAYSTYLLIFTVKGETNAGINSMQIGEARLQTAAGPLDNNGVIGGGQMVPEPGSAALVGLIGLGMAVRRRR